MRFDLRQIFFSEAIKQIAIIYLEMILFHKKEPLLEKKGASGGTRTPSLLIPSHGSDFPRRNFESSCLYPLKSNWQIISYQSVMFISLWLCKHELYTKFVENVDSNILDYHHLISRFNS